MVAVLEGFSLIAAVVAVGWLLAHTGLFGRDALFMASWAGQLVIAAVATPFVTRVMPREEFGLKRRVIGKAFTDIRQCGLNNILQAAENRSGAILLNWVHAPEYVQQHCAPALGPVRRTQSNGALRFKLPGMDIQRHHPDTKPHQKSNQKPRHYSVLHDQPPRGLPPCLRPRQRRVSPHKAAQILCKFGS